MTSLSCSVSVTVGFQVRVSTISTSLVLAQIATSSLGQCSRERSMRTRAIAVERVGGERRLGDVVNFGLRHRED